MAARAPEGWKKVGACRARLLLDAPEGDWATGISGRVEFEGCDGEQYVHWADASLYEARTAPGATAFQLATVHLSDAFCVGASERKLYPFVLRADRGWVLRPLRVEARLVRRNGVRIVLSHPARLVPPRRYSRAVEAIRQVFESSEWCWQPRSEPGRFTATLVPGGRFGAAVEKVSLSWEIGGSFGSPEVSINLRQRSAAGLLRALFGGDRLHFAVRAGADGRGWVQEFRRIAQELERATRGPGVLPIPASPPSECTRELPLPGRGEDGR